MNIDSYFKPLVHLARCELNEIKKSDALTILSYFSFFIPLAVLGWTCLKGRVKEHPPESPKPKTDKVASPLLSPPKSPDDPESMYQKGLNESDPYKATQYFYDASGRGHKEANFQLGIHYLKGHGIEPNYDMARACFKKAVEDGILEAYCQLGYMARNGLGCDKDVAIAAEYYHQANTKEGSVNFDNIIRNMSLDEKAALGLKIKNNKSVIKDPKIAFELIKECADQDHAPSLNYLANCYKNGIGVEKDDQAMLECYILSAEKGYAAAYINLGGCHANGEAGLSVDFVKAEQFFQKAADLGRIDAYHYMGIVFTQLNQKQKAKESYEIGAKLNHPGCCYELAMILKNDKEYERAFELLNNKSLDSDIDAHFQKGEFYGTGLGMLIDNKAAFKHYLMAAEKNHRSAQCYVGMYYENGWGIKKDLQAAYKYYDLAAKQGDLEAQKYAENLRPSIIS